MGLINNNYQASEIKHRVNELKGQGLVGSALNNKIYDEAKSKGVTSGQLENAMDWNAGTVSDWTATNNKQGLTGGRNTNVSNYTAYQAPLTSDDINTRMTSLAEGTSSAKDHEMRMYNEAVSKGMTARQVDEAMGYAAGTTDDWTQRHGLDSIARTSDSPQAQTGYTENNGSFTRQVDQPTETVQGQLEGLLNKNNPLMQRAFYKGQDQANRRGVLNSSMAAEAGQAAMLDAAMPIAAQDAGTYSAQSKVNQNYINQFSLSDKNYQQSAEQAQLNREHEAGSRNQASENAIREGAYDVTANTQGAYLSSIDKIVNNASVSINEIETANDIPQEEKDKMIANTTARRDADLSWTRNLYSNMPTWDLSWINLETMPAAPGLA